MFLKNYTSEAAVERSIAQIERALIKCGVTGILKEYGTTPGEVSAMVFQIRFHDRPISVRLPADKEKCLQALWLDYADGDQLSHDGQRLAYNRRKGKVRADFVEQAARTAWAIVRDWVEIQLSMIQLGQAEFAQVFLPYIWDEEKRETFYQAAQVRGLLGNHRPAGFLAEAQP